MPFWMRARAVEKQYIFNNITHILLEAHILKTYLQLQSSSQSVLGLALSQKWSDVVNCKNQNIMLDTSGCQKPEGRMHFRGIRSSKFKHVYGLPAKKPKCYDNVKITRNAQDSNYCAVNPKFLAIVVEVGGGGSFLVLPLDNTGRLTHSVSKVTFPHFLVISFFIQLAIIPAPLPIGLLLAIIFA